MSFWDLSRMRELANARYRDAADNGGAIETDRLIAEIGDQIFHVPDVEVDAEQLGRFFIGHVINSKHRSARASVRKWERLRTADGQAFDQTFLDLTITEGFAVVERGLEHGDRTRVAYLQKQAVVQEARARALARGLLPSATTLADVLSAGEAQEIMDEVASGRQRAA